MNAFWGDNYQATLVESGRYLWESQCYIELNMVRCGVVKHPREWDWVGYQEIMGHRQRYRRNSRKPLGAAREGNSLRPENRLKKRR